MAEERTEPREINFRQMLPWTELFRSFQVALDPKKLLMAAGGILVMAFWWWVWSWAFYSLATKPEWGRTGPADWGEFQQDRRKWNVLHEAAGKDVEYTDANDLARNPEEFDKINAPVQAAISAIAKNPKASEFQTADGKIPIEGRPDGYHLMLDDQPYVIRAKPFGALRTLPWDEDRGPNPYLLVTGRAGPQWEAGRFWEWLFTKQLPVLIEPLIKFLKPVVYLFDPNAGLLNRIYFLIVVLGTLATWAFFGGAITRMAAVQVARNEKITLTDAVKFVCARYVSFLTAPPFPLAFVAVMVVLLAIFGLIHMIPIFGEIWDGLLWPLVLLAGLAMAVVLVGLVGWPMMYATISTEGSDSFDAISRSYSYVYQSPWHYVWYCVVALAYGAVVVFFVGFMGSLIVFLGKWGMSVGTWPARDPAFLFLGAPTSFGWRALLLEGSAAIGELSWWNYIGVALVSIWLGLVFLLILGFGYSYFWTATTIIYLLMRRKVDDTDMDEVYLEEDEGEESYSASTMMPAPSEPAAAGPSVTMIESPTLRSTGPPPAGHEPAAEAPAGAPGNPAGHETPSPAAGEDGSKPAAGPA
ncbi:MAG TPA: hypothetical protein VKI65_17440 [Gemmataceae bacterium]|nr:hypothetical protein [Gemmataceae bacterium]